MLRTAQLNTSPTYGLIVQLRSDLGGKDLRQGATAMMPPLKPTERELYQLNPVDDVLQRKVSLSVCCIWVPVVPDCVVDGEVPPISWRRWMYEFAHASMLNPHRSQGGELSDSPANGVLGIHGPGLQQVVLGVPFMSEVQSKGRSSAFAQHFGR